MEEGNDNLEKFGIYKLTMELWDLFWNEDSEILMKDLRGKEICRQLTRSVYSISANIEEGYGRGFGKEYPQFLRVSRGSARESKGGYMRKVVFQMMTTLNGTLNDPDAWVVGIPDDLYSEIDRVYGTFDTILVGRTTYEEMVAYWPGAETEEGGSEINKSMARKMNSYKKFVFSAANETKTLEWNNAEQVLVHNDEDIVKFVNELKAQAGGDIHLSGGARLAQTFIRLGLVDEYHFFVYPVVAAGTAWFEQIENKRDMKLLSVTAYEKGVVGLYYQPQNS